MATSDEVRAGEDDPGPRLSVAAVARRLGVAPSTLRTWDRRYGLGPSSHQAGAHRRYTPADLERLAVMRRLTLEGVQPAEAARIAMTAPVNRGVRSQRPGNAPGSPASTSATHLPPLAQLPSVTQFGPGSPPLRRRPGPGVPPGAVGLPIADPPPRGRSEGGAPVIPAARAAHPPPPLPATSPAFPAPPVPPAPFATPPGHLADPRRAAPPSSADHAALVAAVPWAGPAIVPKTPDLPALNLPAALNLPVELGRPVELGLPGPQSVPADVDARCSGETGGRCGGGRVLALAEGTPQARGLARAAMALDSPEIWRILSETIASDGVVRTWNRLAVPVLQAMGERWRATGGAVDVEHLFSETLIDVLRSVVARYRPPRRPSPLLLACMGSEHHTLPLHALAAALAERGTSCRLLGGGLPPWSLVNAVRRTGPSLVFLYAQLPVRDDAMLAELPRQRPAPRLFLGGPGWDDVERPGSARLVGSLREAADAVLAVVRG
jgi:transposase-like protein